MQEEIDRFASVVEHQTDDVASHLLGKERDRVERLTQRFVAAGTPKDLAQRAASALDVFALLDITDIIVRTEESADVVVPLYFTVADRYDVDNILINITDLPRGDRWSALARHALRSDLYAVIAGLTSRVLRTTAAGTPPLERLTSWEEDHAEGVSRARATLSEIASVEKPDLATLSVALRSMRTLIAQGSKSGAHDA